MAEPQAEPLTQSERVALAEAVTDWARRHPRPQDRAFAFDGKSPFSAFELADALRSNEGPITRQFFRMAQFALEVVPFDHRLPGFSPGFGQPAR